MITTLALIGAFCLGLFSGWALCGKKVRALEEQNTIYLRTLIHSVCDQWERSKVSFTPPEPQPPEPKQKPGNLGKATDEYKYGNRAFE